jgi:predicted N-acetyltransferase YhbS
MIIRNWKPGDAEHEARIYNTAAARLPGFTAVSADEIRRGTSARTFDPNSRFLAEDDGQIVAYITFEPSGRVEMPWCLPGQEKMAHLLMSAALRALADRRLTRVYGACRSDWRDQIEFFEDHDFVHVRDMVNYTQSIGDLPTMFQRPGLDVSVVQPADVGTIQELAPGVLRLRGKELANYLLKHNGFPADAIFVLRKDGMPRGVGILIDDAAFANAENLDAKAPLFRFGAFGTEGLPTRRVNGLFSFLAPPGKDAILIGQDLLWYGTARMETNTFEMLAAQVPSDAVHLLAFYERYFRRQGSFPIFERDLATLTRY